MFRRPGCCPRNGGVEIYIRCADCGDTTRVPRGRQERGVTCITCGKAYPLTRVHELGPDPASRYRKALAYSNKHDVDLATAYSVLLGIVGPVSTLPDRRVETTPDAAAEPESDTPRRGRYDAGFIPAVAAGHLSVRQASERGDRVAHATRLSQRYGLSLDIAFLVADNRLSLGEARRSHESAGLRGGRPSGDVAHASPRKIWPSSVGATLLAAAALLAWVVVGGDSEVDPVGPMPSLQGSAASEVQLRTDERGRIVGVSAPDPIGVLRGFCRPEPSRRRCKPVEIRAAVSGAPGLRWGVFRATGPDIGLRAIEIRREAGVRSWTAGDGSGPIDDVADPETPPGTLTIPVTWER